MTFGKQYSLFSDLNELEKMIGELPRYLKGRELYGSIGGGFLTGGTAPKLTIGAMLMRLRRLHILEKALNTRQKSDLHALSQKHAVIRQEQAAAYQQKMEREAHSRLDAMKQFFEECGRDPGACGGIYNPEVIRRTIVQELITQMNVEGIVSEELDQKLRKTDSQLRRYVQPADFVWDPVLAPVYDPSTYWWMYMSPRAGR